MYARVVLSDSSVSGFVEGGDDGGTGEDVCVCDLCPASDAVDARGVLLLYRLWGLCISMGST